MQSFTKFDISEENSSRCTGRSHILSYNRAVQESFQIHRKVHIILWRTDFKLSCQEIYTPNSIRSEAEQFGICKIVPPSGWNPPCQLDMNNPTRFPTKRQNINTLQEGKGFDTGKSYSIAEYKEMADAFSAEWAERYHDGVPVTHEQIAKDYWDIVDGSARQAVVEYGNDLDTAEYCSGFITSTSTSRKSCETSAAGDTTDRSAEVFDDEFYTNTGWNLTRLPASPGSVLKFLKIPVNGVNVPWLYVGMMFASFCWHNEDNYLYSMNYSHFGDVKQWYGVPAKQSKLFEKVREILEIY